jgi:AAA15 family ATPase/GTPase
MLTKVEITNFKNFNETFTFDLSDTKNFEFNQESVKKGIVNKALIYGQNGCGKSNLGFAIFDMVSHLTDNFFMKNKYENYLNADSNENKAFFKFTFLFNNIEVIYEYRKKDYQTLISEKLTIDNEEVIFIDREKSTKFKVNIEGTENLKNDVGNSKISIISYVAQNTILDEENVRNKVFNDFRTFVNNMLFYKILDERVYLGLEQGNQAIADYIVEQKKLDNFEKLLNSIGVKCKLKARNIDGKNHIFSVFKNREIRLSHISSSGTKAIEAFYFWYLKIREKKASFVFIDEFDAFYHHDLSRLVIKMLKEITGTQIILTTHNTSNISNDLLRPDCYFLMHPNKIQSLSRSTPQELRKAHNIEKMYRAGAFE